MSATRVKLKSFRTLDDVIEKLACLTVAIVRSIDLSHMKHYCHGSSRIIICRSICNCEETCIGEAGIPQDGGPPLTRLLLLAGRGLWHLWH